MNHNNSKQVGQQQIQLKISDETLKGTYANMVQVTHSPEEFVIDFMNIYPPTGIVVSRVMLSPGHMKRIAAALNENISRYEQQFGEIKSIEIKQQPVTTQSSDQHMGFDTNNAQ